MQTNTNLHTSIDDALLQTALSYADSYWEELERKNSHDQQTLIGLPHPYIVPSADDTSGFVFDEMYYWDNLFIITGLLASDRTDLAKGIVENEVELISRFGMVPNASRYYMLGRSQPPTLTTQAMMVYEKTGDHDFLSEAMKAAEAEYHNVWMANLHPHNRRIFKGLSRYYDINMLNELAEAESGWDYTPRFDGRCLNFIPIDLNAFLWKYEKDLATYYEQAGDRLAAAEWHDRAETRSGVVDANLWQESREFYFDYDFIGDVSGKVYSLAAYVPMFVGMVSSKRAAQLVSKLDLFETPYGLATTPPEDGDYSLKQWASPNGWAPLHYFVVEGLKRYGYHDEAKRIRKKWLSTNLRAYAKTGRFYEKYNVVDPDAGAAEGVYPIQHGFAWTNAVFEVFARDL